MLSNLYAGLAVAPRFRKLLKTPSAYELLEQRYHTQHPALCISFGWRRQLLELHHAPRQVHLQQCFSMAQD